MFVTQRSQTPSNTSTSIINQQSSIGEVKFVSTTQQNQSKLASGNQQQKLVVLGLQNTSNPTNFAGQINANQPPVSVVPKAGFAQQSSINKDAPPIDDLSHLA